MKNHKINRRKQRLDSLFDLAKAPTFSAMPIEFQSHWARYLCVLVSGFVETSIKDILGEFAAKRSVPQIRGFVSDTLENNRRNMRSETVLQLILQFDASWKQDIEDYLMIDGRKEALDSLVAVRNQIAHGNDVGISLVTIRAYYAKVVNVIDYIEGRCDP